MAHTRTRCDDLHVWGGYQPNAGACTPPIVQVRLVRLDCCRKAISIETIRGGTTILQAMSGLLPSLHREAEVAVYEMVGGTAHWGLPGVR